MLALLAPASINSAHKSSAKSDTASQQCAAAAHDSARLIGVRVGPFARITLREKFAGACEHYTLASVVAQITALQAARVQQTLLGTSRAHT